MRIPKLLLITAFLFSVSESLLAQTWNYSNGTAYVDGHVAASWGTGAFVQLWRDNAIIWKYGSSSQGLRLGSATDFSANSWTERMRIRDNGFVGIGTADPQAPISLGPSFGGGKRLLVYDNGAGSVQAGFGVDMSGSFRELSIFHPTSDGTDGDISFGKRLESSGVYTEAMRITAVGNVGIGTQDTKGYKLAVNGNAVFTKVVVKPYGNWPDYVFQPTYRLLPLSDVEQYINQYHHLPGVTSAEEVEKNGLDIGDNQATLLKKIEELTLYAIQQNKKIEEQDQKQAAWEQQLKLMQNEIRQLKGLLEKKTNK
jgi:hypothetical protein